MVRRQWLMAALLTAVSAGLPACSFFGGGSQENPPLPPRTGSAAAGERPPDRRPGAAIGAGDVTTVRVSVAVFTIPAGSAGGDDELWSSVDEDWGGIRQKTLFGHNGLRLGLVREGGREALLKRLADKSLTEVRRSDVVLPERGSLPVALRRSADPRTALFVYGLNGSLSARQYGMPLAGLQLNTVVQPIEPGSVHLDGAPAVNYRPIDSDPRHAAAADPIRDLKPSELLQLLPSAQAAAAAAAAAATRSGDEPVSELIESLKIRGKIPSGGMLVLGATKDAGQTACAGRLLLVDGPPDVGIESVLLMTFEVIPGRPAGS